MKLSDLLAGRPDFAPKIEIIDQVKRSRNFSSNNERLDAADALLIFSTSKQHTWLVATNLRLYCILDDVRRDEPHINWSLPAKRIFSSQRYILKITVQDKSSLTGTITIEGISRPWLFTKRLFNGSPIEESIRQLAERVMRSEA